MNNCILSTFKLIFWVILSLSGQVHGVENSNNTKTNNSVVIGIDLGTTYSCVGVFQNGRVTIIPNEQGNRITPSYVAFLPSGKRLIGDAAKNQLTRNPTNTIYDIKRIIGRTYDDPTIQSDIDSFSFKIVNNENKPKISVKVKDGGEEVFYQPEEISAMVLSKMKIIAESHLNQNITDAVVTVPAYFNDAQRQATKNAGAIAGLNVIRIINEPTAAAIAYGLNRKNFTSEQKILVFDLGGGTLDVSLLSIESGVFEVMATNGDTHLGGEDFDNNVVNYFVKMLKEKSNIDISTDKAAIQQLRREAEKAKRTLSRAHSVRLEVDGLVNDFDFSETLTRAKFEEINIKLFKQTIQPIKNVLKDAGISKESVAEVVLVGGSTRIPKIQKLVKEFFDGKEPHTKINPDEAIAYGAAVQAGVLSGADDADILLLDVCPLTLGIELDGGLMETLIPRNSPIPTTKRDIFTTVDDYQTSVTTSIYEGERAFVKDNHFLGSFELHGLRSAPKGQAQIEVTFEIDADGLLKVIAEDKYTKSKEHIIIQNSNNRLNPEEIKKMIANAEKYKVMDAKIMERSNKLNRLEQQLYANKNYIEKNKNVLSSKDANDMLKSAAEKIVLAEQARRTFAESESIDLNEIEGMLRDAESVFRDLNQKLSEADKRKNKANDEL